MGIQIELALSVNLFILTKLCPQVGVYFFKKLLLRVVSDFTGASGASSSTRYVINMT